MTDTPLENDNAEFDAEVASIKSELATASAEYETDLEASRAYLNENFANADQAIAEFTDSLDQDLPLPPTESANEPQ